ncbi:MAG: glycosyltransferase [Rubrivivax sp.]|nr:glycosyltransferase [Rubrivivax sp.]
MSIYVGFDQREAVAYHVFCQSVIERATLPLRFTPLSQAGLRGYVERHTDGSNAFIYTRFLVPHLMNFDGWALFADGDMVCRADIAELWALRDPTKAVQVVQHDYRTKACVKYLGNKNENYPRKNWSSVILWNCSHPAHRVLTPEFVQAQPGSYLHRFSWLPDSEIGALDAAWNWLAIEYEDNPEAKLVHYTLGTPCFRDYRDTAMAELWHDCHGRAEQGMNT